ncbi:MAG: MATE family efflux transporter [Eubacteriales bacterium]|nr:MATE family efflux transporter [Eubacteriales bacterium]
MENTAKMNPAENPLGTAPIPKLMLQFGIPSVISMLVNSIYNIVDQIFIGQRVGYLGNAATNVTFPFVTIGMALALMISVGTAANVGLNLGKKDYKRVNLTLGNGFCLALLAGLLVLFFGELFMTPLLRLFGATDLVLPYALAYARIYVAGLPFVTLSIMTSDEIRADGNPRFSMITMLAGAIFNVVFDYIFIFPMNMGVSGAAWATILGQFLTMVLNLVYFRRLKTMQFEVKNMRLDSRTVKSILTLGLSSCATQLAMLVMQIVMNQQTVKYGAMSRFGAEIPLTVFGIVNKVNAIMISIIMGMTVGTQPVYSFNYGAQKYSRVKQLCRSSIIVGTAVGVVGCIILQSFPQQIISIFGSEDSLYNEFAVMALRNMTFLIFILGIQMTANVYFQSIGKPGKALVISLSRQLLFMIPCLLILPIFFNVLGVMWSFPVSDIFSVALCIFLLAKEMKELNRKIAETA